MNHAIPPSEPPELGTPSVPSRIPIAPASPSSRPSELRLIVGATVAAAAHAIIPKPAQPEQDEDGGGPGDAEAEAEDAEPPSLGLKYGPVGEIVSKTTFAGEKHTGEIVDRYVDLYREVFLHDKGTVTYFDAQGNKLGEAVLPDNWYVNVLGTPKKKGQKPPVVREKMTEDQQQAWHNDHRQKARVSDRVLPTDLADLGYPFLATATLYGMDQEENENIDTPFKLLDKRLDNEEVEDPSKRYFQGRKMSLRQAIIEIATAYDVPRAVAFGIGANESAFDRNAVSKRKIKGKMQPIAWGMFQFKEEGYQDAKNYAEQHPELSASIRQGPLLKFNQRFHGGVPEWKNRFVSTEMFCAYYRYLQEKLEPHFDQLEERLRALDPTLLVGTFDTIGTITAYNAGAGRIKACIERFIERSDEELKQKIGEPPYGVDVWMAVLAHSFGATLLGPDGKPLLDKERDPITTKVGPHVLTYASKSLALGSLIMDEENQLSILERDREGWEIPGDKEDSPDTEPVGEQRGGSRRQLLKVLSSFTGAGALFGGVLLGAPAVQEGREEIKAGPQNGARTGLSRRTVLKGGAATAAGTVVFGKSFLSSEKEAPEPDNPPHRYTHEKYEESILQQARANLDTTYEDLRRRGKYDWTPTELTQIRQHGNPKQSKALRQDFNVAFGENWVERFLATKLHRTKRRKSLYEEGERLQKPYIGQAITSGDLVPMEADNPGNPYFCEQVGKTSGTENDSESLYMHKEFVPLLGTLIELVNHQIDHFNGNPAAYGEKYEEFPMIPHVNAVKISGALRSVMQTYDMLTRGQAGRTSKDLSSHWLGQAIDLSSFTTPGSHMVAFAEPLYGRRTSPLRSPLFPANSKLPSQHPNGGRTREILSKMFGRALLALEKPLKAKGITIMPLWEGVQLNWHVAIKH